MIIKWEGAAAYVGVIEEGAEGIGPSLRLRPCQAHMTDAIGSQGILYQT